MQVINQINSKERKGKERRAGKISTLNTTCHAFLRQQLFSVARTDGFEFSRMLTAVLVPLFDRSFLLYDAVLCARVRSFVRSYNLVLVGWLAARFFVRLPLFADNERRRVRRGRVAEGRCGAGPLLRRVGQDGAAHGLGSGVNLFCSISSSIV